MRKIYFLFLFACSLLSTLSSTAQTTVTIPSANTNSGSVRFPLATWWGYERSAMIYTPAEFNGTAGQITSVAFYVNSLTAPGAMTDVRIYMKTRSNLFTAASTYATETTGATLVYGPTTIPASALTAGQWYTITLATPFFYDGSGNLEVLVETNATGGGSGEGGTAKQFRYNTQPDNGRFQTWNNDGTPPAGTGTLSLNRPNIQFNITEPPCVSAGLNGGAAASSTASSCPGTAFTLSVTGASIGSGLTYQWQSSPDNSTWTDIGGATGASLNTSQTGATYYRRKMTCSGTDAFSSEILVTATPAVASFPWTESFDAATIPSCWSNQYVSGTTNWTYVTANGNATITPRSGARMAEFRTASYGPTTKLVTPRLDISGLANPRVVFYYANVNWFGDIDELRIYYKNSAGGVWTQIGSNYVDERTAWTEVALALPNPSNDYYIAFEATSNWARGMNLDDIRVEETPPCLPPTAPLPAAVSPTSHSFSWTASPSNPGSGYQWEVRSSGAAGSGATGLAASGSTAAGVVTATATGLTANTTYSFYVRSNCGSGVFSDWTAATQFTTICAPTNVPYLQNFDNAFSPNFPPCIVTQDLNGGGAWGMWYQGDIVTTSPPNAIRYVWNASTPANDWFFLQGLNLVAGKTYTLNFKYKASDGPDFLENLEVKYGNAPNAAAMTSAAIFSETNISTNVNDPFATASVTFTVPADGVYYIGFRCFSDADQAFLYIDDVSVESCPTPTEVTAISTLPTSVTVNFTSGGNSFVVEYGPVGFVPGTGAAAGAGTVVTATASPVTLTGLNPDTQYDIYVRQNCTSDAEFSANAKVTVRTLCNPVNVPYLQDFTSAVAPGIPGCTSLQDLNGQPTWETMTPPAAWGFNGQTLRYFYDPAKGGNDWFYIQGLNLTAGTQYELSFKYGSTDPLYPERMRVAIGTEAVNTAMTTVLADYPNIVANSAAPFAKLERMIFTVGADGAYYIGFQNYSLPDQFTLYLDSIVVREVPTVDVGVTALLNAPTCPANNYGLTARLHNFNLLPIDFSVNPITVTATITGPGGTSINTVVNSGTLAAGGDLTVTLPSFSFVQGVYNITTTSSSPDDGVASNDAVSTLLVVNGTPIAAAFTPAQPQVCEGGTVLVNTQFTTPAPAPTTMPAVSSGTINLPIPDGNATGVNSTLAVTGVPANAVVTGISVTLNATHTWNSDLVFTLRAPNGRILALANGKGGSGDNYTNAVISSTGTASLPTGATSPITGTFAADATLGVGATGFVSNASSFADLYNVGNGNWTLAVRDQVNFDAGTLVSWSITITYGQPHPTVTWTPTTGLFTNAGATTAYAANTNAYSVYVKPAATSTYTVTSTSQFGCTNSSQVTVTVNPNPVVGIAPLPARICVSDPEVQLTASPVGGVWAGPGVSGGKLIPSAIATVGTFPITYRYTNNFGCTTIDTVFAKLEDCPERLRLLRDDAVILFPNPNNGQFNVRINSTLYNKLTMRVYTTSGMAVSTRELTGLAFGRVIPIDLTHLPAGSYMVQFLYFGGPRTSEKAFNVIIGR
jgi:subtilisin-like proprotein convertase family protein